MADIKPFRGIRYSPSVAKDPADVVCPPYDIISPTEAEALRRRSPYNAVNLELTYAHPDNTSDTDRYARTAELFVRWLESGVLVREPTPAIYLLDESFTFRGRETARRGLMALVRLEEFEKAIVMPHERTTPGPVADRRALLEAARCNFSPLMCLYRDADGSVASLLDEARRGTPLLGAHLEGSYRFHAGAITSPRLLSKIGDALAPKELLMADGHHRYQAALSYRDGLVSRDVGLPAIAR